MSACDCSTALVGVFSALAGAALAFVLSILAIYLAGGDK